MRTGTPFPRPSADKHFINIQAGQPSKTLGLYKYISGDSNGQRDCVLSMGGKRRQETGGQGGSGSSLLNSKMQLLLGQVEEVNSSV